MKLIAVVVFGFAVAVMAAASGPLSLEVERGRAYAQRHCATCHAIRANGIEPLCSRTSLQNIA